MKPTNYYYIARIARIVVAKRHKTVYYVAPPATDDECAVCVCNTAIILRPNAHAHAANSIEMNLIVSLLRTGKTGQNHMITRTTIKRKKRSTIWNPLCRATLPPSTKTIDFQVTRARWQTSNNNNVNAIIINFPNIPHSKILHCDCDATLIGFYYREFVHNFWRNVSVCVPGRRACAANKNNDEKKNKTWRGRATLTYRYLKFATDISQTAHTHTASEHKKKNNRTSSLTRQFYS